MKHMATLFPVVLLLFLSTTFASAADRPNFLIIMGDDCTYSDLPLYGGTNCETPNLDRLASEGLTFNRAFLAEAMCQPCRSELYTGLYPKSNGCCWNHSGTVYGTKSVTHYLGDAGYRVGIAGKVHVTPPTTYAFEYVPGFERGCVSRTAKSDCTGIGQFMSRDDAPFCLVVALVCPHTPWTVGDWEKFDQSKFDWPELLADTPETRQDFAKYLAEIEHMDMQIGQIMQTLEQAGKADDTLVMFTSEQGSQFPGAKWSNWEAGVHTALVARWPGHVEPGKRTDAMVQYADVLPTMLDAAGVNTPDATFDGTSFLPVLAGEKDTHRRYTYGMHNNIPEGPAFPIRTVRDEEFRYIRNLQPENMYIEKHVMGQAQWHDFWPSWLFKSWDDPRTYALTQRYMVRPAEELYHTASDASELKNLADDPAYAEVKARLSAELDRWMEAEGDPGAALDTMEVWQAAKQAAKPVK